MHRIRYTTTLAGLAAAALATGCEIGPAGGPRDAEFTHKLRDLHRRTDAIAAKRDAGDISWTTAHQELERIEEEHAAAEKEWHAAGSR
jgi:hypothetical protein